MLSIMLTARGLARATLCALLTAPLASVASTASQAPPVVRYAVSIGGLPIGEAVLRAATNGVRYEIEMEADIGFLFWGGAGGARAHGRVEAAPLPRLTPERFTLAYQGATRPGRVEIGFEDGRAALRERTPPLPAEYAQGRLPIEPAHLEAVGDPLSAFVIPAPPDARPEALCDRTLAVFSGTTRFDIVLEGVREGATRAPDGPVACAARYRPVSGHRADSAGVARLRAADALEVSLAPLAPGLWGPHSIAVATRFGPFRLERE